MTSRAPILFGIWFLLAGVAPAHANDSAVLRTTYDVQFVVDDDEYRVSSRALVRTGNEIPIEFRDFRIGLRVASNLTDAFTVQITVYERDGANWHQITMPPPEFSGQLGTPTEYTWHSTSMKINLAIVVGVYE